MSRGKKSKLRHIKGLVMVVISISFVLVGAGALWVATLRMPDLNSFQARKISESTKIYDRTGSVLLYDTGKNARLSYVSLASTSPFVQKATIAIEDSNFYKNIGIEPLSILRAILADIASGDYSQGASTITQQVIKNSLLTQEKTITRKIQEWVLAIKLTKAMTKDQILETYLNETPYGGTMYGVEIASMEYFGHPASQLTLAESAYLAAIPQAPTYYSPYGTHRESLDTRHVVVLQRMRDLGFITTDEYTEAKAEKVQFLSKNNSNIRAPHFVMFIKDYLTQKYGEEKVDNGGLKVITTLDYDLQQTAEQVITKFGPNLLSSFNASNTAMVAIDPKTGDILTMVGSKDYFDASIDGNYNIALAKRQPGSTFKPFVYSTLFKKGYTPETVLFDTQTEFSNYCTVEGKPKNPSITDPGKVCYAPNEYDNIFEGPLTVRKALAQSRNIPAVKALYLSGIADSIQTAEDMGITTLTDPNRYGLTLVLGGGEVSLLDLTSAYSVFANDGMRNPYRSVLQVTDKRGVVLELNGSTTPNQALQPEIARQISDILSDKNVRMDSLKPIAEGVGRQVAIKTGTTNDYRDVWAVGYTPNLVVGAWAGNNSNAPMQHNVAGLIIAPIWGAFMSQAVKDLPVEGFVPPPAPLTEGKPVLRGIWQGGTSYTIDKISGKIATQYTPDETKQEIIKQSVHSILYWVNKDDPTGLAPTDPNQDSQFQYWEYGVRKWLTEYQRTHPSFIETAGSTTIPTALDDIHTADKVPKISFVTPLDNQLINPQNLLPIKITLSGSFTPIKTEVYLNGKYVLTANTDPLNFSFVPADVGNINKTSSNIITVDVFDSAYNKGEATLNFTVNQ
ncbi:MAG: penicillin-binding protein [Candidatus Taylorbacteria bacterium]